MAFVLPTIDATGTLGHDLTTHALAERLDAGHRRQTVDQESRSLADEAKAAIRPVPRQSGTEAEVPSVEIPASAENSLLSLGGTVTMVCPACGTPRVGWSRHCRSCGLSFEEVAINEVVQAASHGPRPLARLLYRRLAVLIPGLILLVVGLVVLLVAVALDPSLLAKLQR